MSSVSWPHYPQMPPLTQEETESFLKEGHIAKLGSFNEDGTIHLAPAYYMYEGGSILLGTQMVSRKVRNIRRNNNVSVLIDNYEPPFKGVLIYGKAELDTDDVVAKRTSLFENYMPSDEAAGLAHGLADQFEPVIIRVRPERIVSYDYNKASIV
jgi:nitroimidazol reductase NimA-like FMN-containing flavoprotein (pyridoxamine 5'-phosphate oxidase superfamily)